MSDGDDDKPECSYQNLAGLVGQAACDFVTQSCEDFEVVNLYKLRYCTLPDSSFGGVMFVVINLLMGFAAFYLLSKVASVYLTPVLTKISTALKMSETLSGVTLLAFANGAPDIISSYAAGGSEGGTYTMIGNLFGAGLFCATLVIGRCIMVSKKTIQMEPAHWLRDLTFYILASLLLLSFGLMKEINKPMIIIFLVVYVVYICIVLYQDRQDKLNSVGEDFEQQHGIDKKLVEDGMHSLMGKDSPGDEDTNDRQANRGRGLTLTMAEVKNVYNHEQEATSLEDNKPKSAFDMVIHILTIPLQYATKTTIPNLEEEEVTKPWISLTPLTSSLLFALLVSGFEFDKEFMGINAYLAAAMFSIPLCMIIYIFLVDERKFYQWILVPFALVVSILWLKNSAGLIVDMIDFISTRYNISKVLLGATFLGIGNTLADFYANSSLSALGFGVMACTGSIAGQLFNLLLGVPINVFSSMRTQKIKAVSFDLLDFSDEDKDSKVFALILIGLVISQLMFLLWSSVTGNFILNLKIAKISAVFYSTCYVLFFVVAYILRS